MKRLLFVDDESHILAGLRRMLRPMRDSWQMEFASSGAEALELMTHGPIDVVISDMRMPGMDGASLLSEVKRRHPGTARIILSGQSDEERVLRTVGPAHQFLAKPCEPASLKRTIDGVCDLCETIQNQRVREVIGGISALPSLPLLFTQLLKEFHATDPSLERIAGIIAGDLAMTAKVLQLVNSSFFGLKCRVASPQQAVSMLGLERIRPLALTAGAFVGFSKPLGHGFSLSALIDHSLIVGLGARKITLLETGDAALAEEAMMAGMLHDIGKLILAQEMDEQYRVAREVAGKTGVAVCAAEQELLGASHAELGGYLLALWGLPATVVEAAVWHHAPVGARIEEFRPLTAVHVANTWCRECASEDGVGETDLEYLDRLGYVDRLPKWREALVDITHAEALA